MFVDFFFKKDVFVDFYDGAFVSIHPSRGAEDICVGGSDKGKLIAGTDEYCWGRCGLCYECIHKASPGGLRSGADEGGGYITAWLILSYVVSETRSCGLQTTVSETSANQLANLLFWLMIVGYSMRNIEVRFDMERVLGSPPKIAELPPGETIQ